MATSGTPQWDGVNYKAADAAQQKHPGSKWFAFNSIGRAYLLVNPGGVNILALNPLTSGADPLQAAGGALNAMQQTGAHGYATLEAAVQHGNSINAAVQAIITACDAAASSPVGGGVVGVLETVNAPHATAAAGSGQLNTPTADASTPQNPTTAAAAANSFLQSLSSANLWIRVAKIAIGGVLLIVGAAKLTGADKGVAVLGKAVAKAPLL
jgi:hypothetical protein